MRSGKSRSHIISHDDHGSRLIATDLFHDRPILRRAIDAGREVASIRESLISLALITPYVTWSACEARGKK